MNNFYHKDHLPANPEVGDAYVDPDTGHYLCYDGNEFVVVKGSDLEPGMFTLGRDIGDPVFIAEFPEEKVEPLHCECGVDKAGGGLHSDWCPKHKEGL